MQCQSQVEPSGGALRSLAVGGSGAGRAGCVQGAANVLLGPLTACAGVAAACGAGEGGRFTYSRFVAVVGAAALPRTSTLFALLALSPHHHQTPARLHACLTASPPPRCRPPPPRPHPHLNARHTRAAGPHHRHGHHLRRSALRRGAGRALPHHLNHPVAADRGGRSVVPATCMDPFSHEQPLNDGASKDLPVFLRHGQSAPAHRGTEAGGDDEPS